jgi:hypothetical protein
MTILEQIKQHKLLEVAAKKELDPAKLLELSPYFSSACVSMKKYISDIICQKKSFFVILNQEKNIQQN